MPTSATFSPNNPFPVTSLQYNTSPNGTFSNQKLNDESDYYGIDYMAHNNVYFYEKKPCHSSCATCTGPLDTDCTSCGAAEFQTIVPSACMPCSNNCSTCAQVFDRCGSCQLGFYLDASYKCDACVKDQFGVVGSLCVQCQSNCRKCQGTISTCTACFGAFIVDAQTNTCVDPSTCQINGGFYTETTNGVGFCKKCDASCLTCQGLATTCTSCSSGRFFVNG